MTENEISSERIQWWSFTLGLLAGLVLAMIPIHFLVADAKQQADFELQELQTLHTCRAQLAEQETTAKTTATVIYEPSSSLAGQFLHAVLVREIGLRFIVGDTVLPKWIIPGKVKPARIPRQVSADGIVWMEEPENQRGEFYYWFDLNGEQKSQGPFPIKDLK